MRAGRVRPTAAVLAAALAAVLAACTPVSDPTASPTPSPTATSPSTSASPSATASSPGPSPTGTCEPFGTLEASASSDDWFADLRAGIWGATMRLGVHDCYERWVMEFDGRDDAPGWAVTPHAASTFLGDPSGEPIDPPLGGTASLEVMVTAWFDGTPLDEDPYAGPMSLTGTGAIRTVRILSGFEGMTQVGIGLDEARPYRVMWLEDPGRLVVDVFTG